MLVVSGRVDLRILVLGYGNIGSVIAGDLAEGMPSIEIVLSGRDRSKAEKAAEAISKANVTAVQLDAHDYQNLISTMKQFDLAIGALPGDLGYQSVKAAIDAKIDIVDVSYMPENPLTLNEDAVAANVIVIPDCGVAPGLSSLLIGHAIGELDRVKSVYIMVGGLPEKPVPPLGYTITWSTEGLIDEYTRKARIVEKGDMVQVEALTGLKEVEFPGVGKLEAFFTDGLRTLLQTVEGVEEMWEKTLRYPGHVEKIKALKALGFFDEQPLDIGNVRLSPRKLTVNLLEKKLQRPEVRDILALMVEVNGVSKGLEKRYVYRLLDRYDGRRGVTAMARTTGYPASILAQLIARGDVEGKGVLPLEKLGVDQKTFNRVLSELEKRQIKVVEV